MHTKISGKINWLSRYWFPSVLHWDKVLKLRKIFEVKAKGMISGQGCFGLSSNYFEKNSWFHALIANKFESESESESITLWMKYPLEVFERSLISNTSRWYFTNPMRTPWKIWETNEKCVFKRKIIRNEFRIDISGDFVLKYTLEDIKATYVLNLAVQPAFGTLDNLRMFNLNKSDVLKHVVSNFKWVLDESVC